MTTLLAQIDAITAEAGAAASAVSFYDYASQTSWSCRGGRWFHAASTIKVAVLAALLAAVEEGRFSLADRLHVRNRFLGVHDGAAYAIDRERDASGGIHDAVGKLLRVEALAEAMIATSSNLATNLLLDLVGVDSGREVLARLGLASGIDLVRGVEDDAAHRAGIDNRVTADGLVALFRLAEEGAARLRTRRRSGCSGSCAARSSAAAFRPACRRRSAPRRASPTRPARRRR